MDALLAAPRPAKGGGLLGCLLGMDCVVVCFFWLPLYSLPAWAGGSTQTGWEFARETTDNMVAQGMPLGSLLPISLTFLPIVSALILGILAIARVFTPHAVLATLFLVVYVLGSVPLLLFAFGLAFGSVLRLGYCGGILGYLLLLAGDLALRRAAAQSASS